MSTITSTDTLAEQLYNKEGKGFMASNKGKDQGTTEDLGNPEMSRKEDNDRVPLLPLRHEQQAVTLVFGLLLASVYLKGEADREEKMETITQDFLELIKGPFTREDVLTLVQYTGTWVSSCLEAEAILHLPKSLVEALKTLHPKGVSQEEAPGAVLFVNIPKEQISELIERLHIDLQDGTLDMLKASSEKSGHEKASVVPFPGNTTKH